MLVLSRDRIRAIWWVMLMLLLKKSRRFYSCEKLFLSAKPQLCRPQPEVLTHVNTDVSCVGSVSWWCEWSCGRPCSGFSNLFMLWTPQTLSKQTDPHLKSFCSKGTASYKNNLYKNHEIWSSMCDLTLKNINEWIYYLFMIITVRIKKVPINLARN